MPRSGLRARHNSVTTTFRLGLRAGKARRRERSPRAAGGAAQTAGVAGQRGTTGAIGPARTRVMGGDLRAARSAGLVDRIGAAVRRPRLRGRARRPSSASACSISRTRSVKWRDPALRRKRRRHLRLRHRPVTTPGARNCADDASARRAPTPPRTSAKASSAARSRPPSACGRRPPTSASARRPMPPRRHPDRRAGRARRPRLHQRRPEGGPDEAGGKKIIGRSLICLNPTQPWKIGFDGRLDVYDLRYTIAHEIGHAIGLDHPSAAGQLMSYRYDERQPACSRATSRARRCSTARGRVRSASRHAPAPAAAR